MNNKDLIEKIENHINKEYPELKSRVNNLEKKQSLIDTRHYEVVEKLTKAEGQLNNVTEKVVYLGQKVDNSTEKMDEKTKKMGEDIIQITQKVDKFTDSIRKEHNRNIKWVAGLIFLSLVGGTVAVFIYFGGVVFNISDTVRKIENTLNSKIVNIEKDIIKLNVKVDTTTCTDIPQR